MSVDGTELAAMNVLVVIFTDPKAVAIMSISLAAGHLHEMSEADRVYSPASSYSTYSHEVKYIFDPKEDSDGDEYTDYSQITTRTKHAMTSSYTPRTLSATSHTSAKDCQASQREDPETSQQLMAAVLSRTNSVLSSRGPISPRLEEVVYSTSHYANGPRKLSAPQDHVLRERNYYGPGGEVPPYPYAKHSYPVWKNNNNNSNVVNNGHGGVYPSQQPSKSKNSNLNLDSGKHNRNSVAVMGQGGQLNSFHNHHPLSSTSIYNHYQQQHQAHPQAQGNEPPYPYPPRYNHQQHMRRKTWSPPALKMSLMNSVHQGSRVCYSNDSLDLGEEAGIERKTQSLSEDLDVTPPRLAPVSGVLAQVSWSFF
ncbi:hypothetical protein Btru_027593 [Bulinus truncatus]|nr:hypothetical protein Btru_027593 [Bulinus truncatus]